MDEKKYKRLVDRLNELSVLNANIGRLAFYMNNNHNRMVGVEGKDMTDQLDAMCNYRAVLERRIIKGIY